MVDFQLKLDEARRQRALVNVVNAQMPEHVTVRSAVERRPYDAFALQYTGTHSRTGKPEPIPAVPAVVPTIAKIGHHISASQLKTKERCARLWAVEKLWHMRRPDAMHFHVGHALHGVAERYLMRVAIDWESLFPVGWDKLLDDEGREYIRFAARQAVTLGLWQVVEGIQVECPCALLVGKEWLDERGMPLPVAVETGVNAQGVREITKFVSLLDGRPLPPGWDRLPPFIGFIDLVSLQTAVPEVSDHKSAKNRRYTLSPDKLERDRQVNCYAAWSLAIRKDADRCAVRHIVFLKSMDAPEPAFETRAMITLEAAAERWLEVIQHAEDMKLLRDLYGQPSDPDRPYNRADRWLSIRGAVDDGGARAKESCDAYGGCPFKDVCFGRATAADVMKRLDTPSLMNLVRKPPVEYTLNTSAHKSGPAPSAGFSLNLSHHRPPQPKEAPMVFGPGPSATFPVKSDVYIRDADNPQIQFKARVFQHLPDNELLVGLWPHPDREPNWTVLPRVYSVPMPASEFSAIPFVGVHITGYQEALVNAGMGAGSEWHDTMNNINTFPESSNTPGAVQSPAAPTAPLHNPLATAAPPTIAAGFVDTKITRPPVDGQFGSPAAKPSAPAPLVHSPGITVTMDPVPASQAPAASKGQALAQQMQAAQAAEAANQVPPPQGWHPVAGDKVEVLPTQHKFWGPLAGKQGIVQDVTVGETQDMLTVEINGMQYPDVQSGRFKCVQPFVKPQPAAPAAPAAQPQQQTLQDATQMPSTLEDALSLVGKNVVVGFQGALAPTNAVLEAADATGIKIMGTVYPWAQVVRLTLMIPTDIPGAKAPKLSRADKAAAKEKEAVAARQADRHHALQKALDLVTAVLGAEGKATKKTFEAVKPLLEDALAYQQEIQTAAAKGLEVATGAVLGAAAGSVEPLYPVPQVLSALDETVRRIAQVQAMLRQNAGLPQ